jgi:hypothetical protein
MTTYKVLYLEPDAAKYELLPKTFDASSAPSAAKAAALDSEQPGQYVAIPARSWDPLNIEIETNPRVKVVK